MGGGEGETVRQARYAAFDVLRAIALISMVSGHVTDYPLINTAIRRALHSARWIDGAFFFVALSGVVTGLVHRRVVEHRGLRASSIKLARRAAFLYTVHIGLALLLITVHSADPNAAIRYTPTWTGHSGPLFTIVRVVNLRIEPDFTGVLPMYVVFLLGAIVVVRLLAAGRTRLVAALSLGIYFTTKALGGAVLAPLSFDVGAWQLLFIGGLLVGWAWERERLLVPPAHRRTIVLSASAVALACLVLARLANPTISRLRGAPVDKMSGGLLAFAFTACALTGGYVVIERLRRSSATAERVIGLLAIAGSKGLPGYVAMVVSVLVLQTMPSIRRDDTVVVAVIVVCGVTEYLALRLDDWRRGRRQRANPTGFLVAPSAPPALLEVS